MTNMLDLASTISALAGLIVLYVLRDTTLHNSVKYFILPLSVMNITHVITLYILPIIGLNTDKIGVYYQNNILSMINSTGYMSVFPPLFIVMVVFIALLYSRKLSTNV